MADKFINKIIISFPWIFEKFKFFQKTSPVVTVSLKAICYNGPENMKSAFRNPKSEMGGPYLPKPSVIMAAFHPSTIFRTGHSAAASSTGREH